MSANPPPRRVLRIALGLTLGATILVFALALAAAWEHTADDAYITLRYARHLAEGAGIVWNPGEPPVEGYSNFLFVLLGAALLRLGSAPDPMPWLAGLGGLAALGSLFATYRLGLRLARTGDDTSLTARATATAAVVALALHPGQSFWAVSGMETTVGQFLILLAAWAVCRAAGAAAEKDGGRATALLAASVLVFLASITRPESPVLLAAFLPVATFAGIGDGWRGRLRRGAWLLLPFLALYLPYTLWRLATFGRWLPNSAACKAGMAAEPWLLGRSFLASVGVLVVLALLGLALRPRRDHFYLLGIPLLYLGVFRDVDPVMSHLDRHFLAALPFVAIAAALGLRALCERLLPVSRRAAAAAPLLVALTLFFGALEAPKALASVRQAVRLAHPLEDVRRELAADLAERLRPGEAFAIGDTGLVPFLVGARVLDVYCLNCREATAPPIDRSPHRLADWILSQSPRFVVVQIIAGAAERGVFPADRALQRHRLLRVRYQRMREYGGPSDPLHYVVYERRSGASI